jgi:predicted Zn-dependent protease
MSGNGTEPKNEAIRRGTGRVLGGLCLALLLGGCAILGFESDGPPLPDVKVADTEDERDHAKLVSAFGGEVSAPEAHSLVSDIADRLVRASDRPDERYRITILNSPVVNAFALPNGRLYVTRGLLALANDSAEIAAVLSHEIAHVTLRHAVARSEEQAKSALLTQVTETVLKNPVEAAIVRDRSRISLASFSRSQELEADQAGVKVLARAGYDPFGAPRFLTSLDRAGGGADQNRPALTDMLASHPTTAERIAKALQAARRASAPGIGDTDRRRYLAAVDGLAYGDDPRDGVIRGRLFAHGRLGVTFEAPEGFSLENTSEAVLGASASGSERLLFDAAETPAGQSLEHVLRTTWSDTIDEGSLESATVNDLPVATARSTGQEWAFRLAAIRIGGTVFRLVVASKVGHGDLEGLFQRTLSTVRHITLEEARAIRPLRIRVVTALPGDTAESMAARMAVNEKPLEQFLTLNGLEEGAVRPGERYKIVVE